MNESKELAALRRFMVDSGIPHVITATLGRFVSSENPCAPHSATSLHCAPGTDGSGRAADFGGPGGGLDQAGMRAVFDAFSKVAPSLAELIHNGPGIRFAIKAGKWVDPIRVYGATVWAIHTNHVHVGVDRGVFVRWPAIPTKVPAPVSAPLPVLAFDYEEAAIKTRLVFITLDGNGNGWSDWDPVLGRDPIIVGLTKQGPSPPDDGNYWDSQHPVDIAAQPHAGVLRVVARGGKPGDTIGIWAAVS